ncbi:MAG TPA: cytochrome c biogenesis protein CcsA [bacterium]|nr:cytochrome c biogenesis protein CcsA [bacterium]
MTTTLHSGGWLFYLAASVAYFAYLFWPRPWLGRLATAVLGVGFLGHSVCFVVQATGAGIPFESKALVLSLFSWAIVGLYLASLLRSRMTILGAFVAPVAMLMALLSEAAPGAPIRSDPHPKLWLAVHIVTVMLGYAGFAVSSGVSVAYLIQERFLRSHRLGPMFRRLPSLDALDRLNQAAVFVGFGFLSIGLFSGAAYATIAPRPGYQIWADPSVLFTAAMWVWYAFGVQSRLFAGWRGRRSAVFAIVGFAALFVVFVGVLLTRQSFHLMAAG